MNEVAWLCKLAAELKYAVVDEVGDKHDVMVDVQGEVTGRLHAGFERLQCVAIDVRCNHLQTGSQRPISITPVSL